MSAQVQDSKNVISKALFYVLHELVCFCAYMMLAMYAIARDRTLIGRKNYAGFAFIVSLL